MISLGFIVVRTTKRWAPSAAVLTTPRQRNLHRATMVTDLVSHYLLCPLIDASVWFEPARADQVELKVATQVHEEKENYPMQVGVCWCVV